VKVQEEFMSDKVLMAGNMALAAISVLLAGRVMLRRTQQTSTKAACLCISFMWAGQAIKFLEEACGLDRRPIGQTRGMTQVAQPWPVQGFASAASYGMVSIMITVGERFCFSCGPAQSRLACSC
jgi:hypothetical protein